MIYVYIGKWSPQSSWLIDSSPHIVTFFFNVWWEKLESTFLAKFKYMIQYYLLWSPYRKLDFRNLFVLYNWNFVLFDQCLPLHPPASGNHHSTVLLSSTILDPTCKWNHLVLSFCAWLISSSITTSKFVYVIANGRGFPPSLRLSPIPLYINGIFSLCINI